jgi:asparagine synthase (glutamine-hydrolysing)
MCGINGCNFKDKDLIYNMNVSISYRGPNDNSVKVIDDLTFGHLRLSILDLSKKGKQPMKYIHKNREVHLVYNGEIYNYLELKEELIKKNYRFTSESDSEVILASYLEYGEDCVSKFNGMWAFCIYDVSEKKLFCSRDRFGKKPFYYYSDDGMFIFSSELKAILQNKKINFTSIENLNKEAVEYYFSLGFVPSPLTIYKNVKKLPPSHNLIFDLNKKKILKLEKYYEIPSFKPIYDRKKLIEIGKNILYDAVKIRMRSDVEVGAFLSGGLDSSTIVAEMKNFTSLKKLHTFSVGFEGKKYDETPYINIVKDYFKTQHHHKYFTKKIYLKILKKFSEIYDEPFWDYSGFPMYYISQEAKKHVTVVFSGDGGDEIFGGYNSHLAGARFEWLVKSPTFFRKVFAKIPFSKNLNGFFSLYSLKEACKLSLYKKNQFYSMSLKNQKYTPKVFRVWSEKNLSYCIKKGGGSLTEGLRIYDLLFNTIPDNFLVKVDRASMQNNLEVRSPFLDYRMVEFAQKIPTKWKVSTRKTKILMREIISEILPKEVVNRGKQGFNPPLKEWIISKNFEEKLLKKLELLYDKSIITRELYLFYKNKVFKENNELYKEYKIKLYLFDLWVQRWLKI